MRSDKGCISNLLKELTDIGVALSAEKDHTRLLELILIKAKAFTHADGGTLYTRTDNDHLRFEIMITRSLNMHMGGTSGQDIPFPPLRLYDEEGAPNKHMVAAWAALSGETINIEDAYSNREFDFSGTRKFDHKTGYHSQSFLTVPMTNHENEIIGVLQLINATSGQDGGVIPFSSLDQQLVESLASQAAVTITNRQLINAQKALFDALIQLIAAAIDEKSPYTAGHCRRVPVLTNMLADATCRVDWGPLKNFHMTETEKYELEVAAWLHDCGKITTPEYVVDKSTKLETIYDRIHDVDVRFEVVKRDAIIRLLRARLAGSEHEDTEQAIAAELARLDEQREFIRQCNIGGEFLPDEDQQKIAAIATQQWRSPEGKTAPLLSADEVQNLQISRGTLSVREREIINNHVAVTIKMLESLPYPKHLKRVPEYAGGHHERMDGKGYPNGLKREDMSIPARMVAIADVFEALTAKDRPYKKAMSLSQSLRILGDMKLEHHVDPDLFDIFIHEKVYACYAEKYLNPEQIDPVDVTDIPGYKPRP